MYSKDMLIGILLSSAKMDFNIERVSDSKMGYRVKMSLVLRAEEDFLLAVKRTLLQHGISSNYKESESKIRPKPMLRIGGVKNLYIITEMIPNLLPDAKGEWNILREVIEILNENLHRTSEGLDRIFELKGVL